MDQPICPPCGAFLVEPYVKCTACKVFMTLCLPCFAKGREFDNHKNNHSFVIMRNNFPLFGSTWMANEELKLLDAILQCGMGNWSDIADMVGTKSKTECEKHYLKYYVENATPPLPVMKKRKIVARNLPAPIAYTPCQDPPRPEIASVFYNEMAGYMPGRGDFAIEYDDYAEMDLKDLDFTDDKDQFDKDLQLAVINVYRNRQRERARRKCILRNYGLISSQKNLEEWRRYGILGKPVIDKMKGLMKLLKPFNFDKFMEGILYEKQLKNRIKVLQECRQVGIKEVHNIDTYLRLKLKAQERRRNKSLLDNILSYMKECSNRALLAGFCKILLPFTGITQLPNNGQHRIASGDDFTRQQYFRKQMLTDNGQGLTDTSLQATGRRTAPPLVISGLPGYEKLTEKERDLCSVLRLYPTAFLQHKTTLLNEFRKLGSLRLANARAVIKIDVNKTRKIYDLLVEEGLVSK